MATAYIEKISKKHRGRHSFYLTVKRGGRRKRKYIPLWRIPTVIKILEMRKQNKSKRGKTDRPVSEPREKSFFTRPMRLMLESAGYSVHGSTLKKGKNFLSKSAASVRFGMLDQESREAVGTPENLLRINAEAHSLLKHRNRYGIKTNYQKCMTDVMEEEHVEKEEK